MQHTQRKKQTGHTSRLFSTLADIAERRVAELDRTPTTATYQGRYTSEHGEMELRLSVPQASSPHTEEQAPSGVYYVNGLPSGKDANPEYAPRLARGMRSRPGTLFQYWIAEPVIRRSWMDKTEGLLSARYDVVTPEGIPEGMEAAAEERRAAVEAALFGIEGGFRQLVIEYMLSWICGFVLFELVDNPDGTLRKIALREPWTVKAWIFDDESGRDWIATEFEATGTSAVLVGREHLINFRNFGFGADQEGNSEVRTAAKWVEIKQLAARLEAMAAEVRGVGLIEVQSAEGKPLSEAEARQLVSALAGMVSVENPIICLPDGSKLVLHSPAGAAPDFSALKKYCDDQIALVTKGEGALVGMADVGTMGHAVVKDEQQIRSVASYAERFVEGINQAIRRMEDLMGGPVGGVYCELQYGTQARAKSPEEYEQLMKLVQARMLTWTRDDEQQLREELGLAPLPDSVDSGGSDDQGDPDDTGGGSPFQISTIEPIAASHSCGPGCSHDTGERGTRAISLRLSKLDEERLREWLGQSERAIGQRLRAIAREYREEYVRRTAGVTDPVELANITESMRRRWLGRFENAVRGQIVRLTVKGSATLLYELGVIKSLPQIPADAGDAARKVQLPSDEYRRYIDLVASRMGRHALNVTEHYLETNAQRELDPGTRERQRPEIPTQSAFQKTASQYVGTPFNKGRDLIIQSIRNRAEARGLPPKVVCEYSSVLESNTCPPCKAADGMVAIYGSNTFAENSPPNLCEGFDRCRCIWSYILPDEGGYTDILDELGVVWRGEDGVRASLAPGLDLVAFVAEEVKRCG